MTRQPVLFWPASKACASDLYDTVRKKLCEKHDTIPQVISVEPEISTFFKKNPDAILYYPVFENSKGWWGQLLGTDAKIEGRIAIDNIELMAISALGNSSAKSLFLAAEIFPTTQFFKKTLNGIAQARELLATDSGTVLGLFTGKHESRFQRAVECGGNFYLGCIGGY